MFRSPEVTGRHDTVCRLKLFRPPEENAMTIKRHNPGPVLCRAVEHGGLVYVAGTTADNKGGACKAQSEEVLRKIDAALAAAGSDKSKILWAQVWLADIREKDQMDAAWKAGSTRTTSRCGRASRPVSARRTPASRSW
jgi:enamine deaminase RidA (YjgF/YER057c/UK114 family)